MFLPMLVWAAVAGEDPLERRLERRAQPPTALPVGRVDLKLKLGAESQVPGPAGLGLAFVSRYGLGASVDLSVGEDRGAALTLGAEGQLGRALLLQSVAEDRLTALAPGRWDLELKTGGALGRVGVHLDLTELGPKAPQRLSPYVLFLAGYERSSYHAAYVGSMEGVTASAEASQAPSGGRVGGALGLNILGPRRNLIAVELRYLVAMAESTDWSVQAQPTALQNDIGSAFYAEEAAALRTVPQGFAWSVSLGHRF